MPTSSAFGFSKGGGGLPRHLRALSIFISISRSSLGGDGKCGAGRDRYSTKLSQ